MALMIPSLSIALIYLDTKSRLASAIGRGWLIATSLVEGFKIMRCYSKGIPPVPHLKKCGSRLWTEFMLIAAIGIR